VATTAAGFGLAPSTGSLSTDLALLGWTAAGVALSSFGANSFNQWLEAPLDSQMGRTCMRPLPTHQLTSFHAFNFALASSACGVGLLLWKTNWLAALLSGTNILLYAAFYTPMKRLSVGNTWMGAIVGAIPPLIGYIGHYAAAFSTVPWSEILPPCSVLALLLYCWQFPHFMALSWNIRGDYARAGYFMASVLRPSLTTASALRHSSGLAFIAPMAWYTDLVGPEFMLSSLPLNAIMIFLAVSFWRKPHRESARKLFFYTLLYLPVMMSLLLLHRHFPMRESKYKPGASE